MENIKCKMCGRKLTNTESIKLKYGKKCYRKFQHQQALKKESQELIEMKQKWNQLSLKNSVLEKKIVKLENTVRQVLKSGIHITDKISHNTEEIKRIMEEHAVPKTEQEVNFCVVIKELKISIQNGIQLEKVPESFLNHKNIYQPIAIEITTRPGE